MNPILYDASETAFTSNGIGRLTDCISCEVTEERNGIYELTMEYPMTGQHYADIMEGRIVFAPHDDTKDPQPFIIYRRSAPLNGIVTFDAYHLSYRLSEIAVQPFTAVSCPDAMSKIVSKSINTNPFTFDTSKTVVSPFEITVPRSVRSLLGGEQGSILDVYGKGEYEFDKWSVYLHLNRGQDRGVTIRYGKNLTDLTHEVDASGLYNAVIPYYQDEHDTVMLPEWYVTTSLGDIRAMVLDLSDEFDDVPSEQDLRDAATAALTGGMTPKENIEVSFIALWQTEEYKNFAALQRVLLCDTVTVEYPALGTSAKAQVIKVVYDALNERYTEMELGEAKKSLAQVIMDTAESAVMEKAASKGQMAVAIEYATQLIKGGYGGHVVIGTNADGEPNEIYIMDTADQATATDVIRMNVAGIGFSTTGIGGPYSSAWTIDGRFNADFIATGHLVADFIQGGTLTLGGLNNEDGVLQILDASNNVIGTWDKDGISAEKGVFGSWHVNSDGKGLYCEEYDASNNRYVTYLQPYKAGTGVDTWCIAQMENGLGYFRVMADGRCHIGRAEEIMFPYPSGGTDSTVEIHGRKSDNTGNTWYITAGGDASFNYVRLTDGAYVRQNGYVWPVYGLFKSTVHVTVPTANSFGYADISAPNYATSYMIVSAVVTDISGSHWEALYSVTVQNKTRIIVSSNMALTFTVECVYGVNQGDGI